MQSKSQVLGTFFLLDGRDLEGRSGHLIFL